MKKKVSILIVLVLFGLLGWQIYEKASAQRTGGERRRGGAALAVEAATVRKAHIADVGRFSGSLYPRSEFTIAPKVSGRIEQILVDIGDTVDAGSLVAVLDAEEFRQQVIQAEAELQVAKATLKERRNTLENTRREYERTEALRKKKIVSESQLDTIASEYRTQEAKLQVVQAQVAQEQAALEAAKIRLSYSRIKVPESGDGGFRVVGERFVDVGALLSPNQPIVSILEIGKLRAIIFVIERDYPKIRQGLTARITTDAYPGETFTGKVIRIAPLLREKSREARVEIEIDNAQKLLKPGMFVRVAMAFQERQDATVVPVAAVVKRDGIQGVFMVAPEDKAKFVPITLGIVNGELAEVLTPAISGRVITLGQHLLEDGGRILLPGQGEDSGGKRPGKKRNSNSTGG